VLEAKEPHMSLKLGTLFNNRDKIPTIANWFVSEWPEYFADHDVEAYLEAQANAETLPMALVMFDGDELVGTVTIKRESIEAFADRSPWIAKLYVPVEHRGRGIGQLLVTAASRVAFGSGAESVFAGVSEAGQLFDGLGWQSIGEADQNGQMVTVYELERPPEPPSFYEMVGGAENVRELVDRFYDLMDERADVQELRDMHAKSLKVSRQKLFEFLSGWMGGPSLYIEKYGHPRLRMRHMPFSIGTEARDQWLLCMDQALDEVVEDEQVREQLKDSFARIADHMRNRRGP
jgi:hemoglobin